MYFYKNARLIEKLKNIIWDLNRGVAIEGDFDTVEAIETAIEEIEEGREFDIDRVTELIWEQDSDTVSELIKELRTIYKSYDDREKTVDDLAEQIIEWYDMSVKELRAEADYQKLATSGTKKEIIIRLKEKYLQEHKVIV